MNKTLFRCNNIQFSRETLSEIKTAYGEAEISSSEISSSEISSSEISSKEISSYQQIQKFRRQKFRRIYQNNSVHQKISVVSLV